MRVAYYIDLKPLPHVESWLRLQIIHSLKLKIIIANDKDFRTLRKDGPGYDYVRRSHL